MRFATPLAVLALTTTFACGGNLAPADLSDAGGDGTVPSIDATAPDARDGAVGPDASPSPDGAVPPHCGPDDCDGCCRADGTCDTKPSSNSCGLYGAACEDCGSDPAGGCNKPNVGCNHAVKTCDGCTGCCYPPVGQHWGFCSDGTFDLSCGQKGETCAPCPAGTRCEPSIGGGGTCVPSKNPCTPQNCAGCCFGDICAVGTQQFACGTGGQRCETCSWGSRKCVAGACH